MPELELELEELLARPELEELDELEELELVRPELEELELVRPELDELELDELELDELLDSVPEQAASAILTSPTPIRDNESADPLNNFMLHALWFLL
jgi:hypothetical protein